MADPSSTPDPASIAAGVAAVGSLLHRVLDVGGARKRLAALEARLAGLRTDLDALSARLTRREQRADTGSQRATVVPPAASPDLERRLADLERRLADLERRATAIEESSDERARWERTIAADVARLEGHLSARVRRARERESDG